MVTKLGVRAGSGRFLQSAALDSDCSCASALAARRPPPPRARSVQRCTPSDSEPGGRPQAGYRRASRRSFSPDARDQEKVSGANGVDELIGGGEAVSLCTRVKTTSRSPRPG